MLQALHFAWVTAGTPFDPAVHTRSDEAIRRMEISAAEGSAPVARVVVANAGRIMGGPNGERHCHISATLNGEVTSLFHGVLAEVPDGLTGTFLTLLFDSRPENMDAALAEALAPLKVAPGWDPLFVDPDRENDPDEILDGWFARPWINRRTRAVGITHALVGERSFQFCRHRIAEGSLDLRLTGKRPPAWIDGEVSAVWLQRGGGVLDIGAAVRAAVGGAIVTLSPPEEFAHGWPKPGQRLNGESGYRVLQAALLPQEVPAEDDPVLANDTVVLTAGHTITLPAAGGLGVAEEAPFGPTRERSSLFPVGLWGGWMSFKKLAYWPVLTVAWQMRQRRREVVRSRLFGHTAVSLPGADEGETIAFHLRDVGALDTAVAAAPPAAEAAPDCVSLLDLVYPDSGDEAAGTAADGLTLDPLGGTAPALGSTLRASFFQTDRGKAAVAHMLRVMAVRLAFAQRCVTVSVEMPGWRIETLSIDLDCTVTLISPRLPGGQATGKVVGYTIWFDPEQGFGIRMTLACSIGGGGTLPMAPTAGTDTYAEDLAETYTLTEGGVERAGDDRDPFLAVAWQDYGAQQPADGLAGAHAWSGSDLLQRLCIRNLWDEQDSVLWAGRGALVNPRRQLMDVPTDVCLSLRPLAACDEVTHTITVTPAGAFGLPRGIDLEGRLD